jgi:sporulation protein YlmC with PRC-barrel domain
VICASDLIGCELRTQSGRRLGRVHDLRAHAADNGWQLVGLVIGRRGVAARLVGGTGSNGDPLVQGDVIPWHAVTTLEAGLIVVHDEF